MKTQSENKLPIILGLVVGVGLLVFFFQKGDLSEPVAISELTGESNATALSSKVPVPDGYIQYRNEKYQFSFYHSPEGVVHQYEEEGGAQTVTLEDRERGRGLQIFVVPYSESTISEERFRMDVPSRVRNDVENTQVDGVQAVTFRSKDASLGDTREVWFIHKGYLYEVTTFANTSDWFVPIMQSWEFL
jgi:hypothetical protein